MSVAEPQRWHSELLHNSAAKWGLKVMPGRPLIDTDTVPPEYVRLPVVEELTWQDRDRPWIHAYIGLVSLNGQWSYTYSYQVRGDGAGFGPFMKFCDPFPSREEALRVAVIVLNSRTEYGPLRSWLASLTDPVQLGLFADRLVIQDTPRRRRTEKAPQKQEFGFAIAAGSIGLTLEQFAWGDQDAGE